MWLRLNHSKNNSRLCIAHKQFRITKYINVFFMQHSGNGKEIWDGWRVVVDGKVEVKATDRDGYMSLDLLLIEREC